MRFICYLKDKFYSLIIFLLSYILILLMLLAFKIERSLIVAITLILIVCYILLIIIDYYRKKAFYTNLLVNIAHLDKSYLVLETLSKPHFYEGKLLYQALYDINKSMCENVKSLECQVSDFKEYIEMWIHEIKIPLSSLILMSHNHKENYNKKSLEQIKKIDDYIEQVLYYVRQDFAEKDYLINEVCLDKVISAVALKNKNDLLENNISLIVTDVAVKVLTDSKWLEFILNQIVNNSIKYRNVTDAYIKISVTDEDDKAILIIEDNGIGIPSTDISKVFEKTFTGYNGRVRTKSTGMGLFIVWNLCNKLGHKINIESKQNKYTKVYITFFKNNFYDVVK